VHCGGRKLTVVRLTFSGCGVRYFAPSVSTNYFARARETRLGYISSLRIVVVGARRRVADLRRCREVQGNGLVVGRDALVPICARASKSSHTTEIGQFH
jgi:hypothetical protein